jgi:hypothetical protein
MTLSTAKSAPQTLTWLAQLGISIEVVGDDLRLRPSDKVTPEVTGRVRACKVELLRAAPRPSAPPSPAKILRHCRCTDCSHWDDVEGICRVHGFTRYLPREDSHPSMQPFWTDLGTVRPDEWHYCADYRGPTLRGEPWLRPQTAPLGATPSPPRLQAAELIRDARRAGDRGRAIAMRDAWRERLAICEIDGSLPTENAQQIALKELYNMYLTWR